MIINHGWPGSIIEQLKIIEPLTNPTAHGGSAEDAFHVVIPSMPGYGFSGKPTTPGWGPERIARAWATLMERLGYQRYAAQGGDWGALIVDMMGVQAPPGLIGIHTNMAGAIPPELDAAAFAGAAPPPGLDEEEKRSFEPRLLLLQAWSRLCPGDGEPAADAVWDRGFSGRPGRVDSSTMISGPTGKSPGCSTAPPRASPGTIFSTTSPTTG